MLYYLIPGFYMSRKYIQFFAYLLLSFSVIIVLPCLLFPDKLISESQISTQISIKEIFPGEIKRNLYLFVGISFLALVLRINSLWKISQQEKLNAELAYLKAQINPHFLFNTLNSIYSLTIVKSDKAPTAIVKLSSMMRYVISEASGKFVSLEKEMSYINSYIELQKIRLDNTAIVNFSFQGNPGHKVIAPLVLLPFIENAFKHGVNPEATSQIDIQISISDENLYMNVFNLKVPHVINPEHSTGFGLENSRRQLELIYPNQHVLTIEDKDLSFAVNLKIHLS